MTSLTFPPFLRAQAICFSQPESSIEHSPIPLDATQEGKSLVLSTKENPRIEFSATFENFESAGNGIYSLTYLKESDLTLRSRTGTLTARINESGQVALYPSEYVDQREWRLLEKLPEKK